MSEEEDGIMSGGTSQDDKEPESPGPTDVITSYNVPSLPQDQTTNSSSVSLKSDRSKDEALNFHCEDESSQDDKEPESPGPTDVITSYNVPSLPQDQTTNSSSVSLKSDRSKDEALNFHCEDESSQDDKEPESPGPTDVITSYNVPSLPQDQTTNSSSVSLKSDRSKDEALNFHCEDESSQDDKKPESPGPTDVITSYNVPSLPQDQTTNSSSVSLKSDRSKDEALNFHCEDESSQDDKEPESPGPTDVITSYNVPSLPQDQTTNSSSVSLKSDRSKDEALNFHCEDESSQDDKEPESPEPTDVITSYNVPSLPQDQTTNSSSVSLKSDRSKDEALNFHCEDESSQDDKEPESPGPTDVITSYNVPSDSNDIQPENSGAADKGDAKEEKYLKKVILEEVGQQESDPKLSEIVMFEREAKEEKYLKEVILEKVGQQESDPKLSEIVMFESGKKNLIMLKDLFTNNKSLISKLPRMNNNTQPCRSQSPTTPQFTRMSIQGVFRFAAALNTFIRTPQLLSKPSQRIRFFVIPRVQLLCRVLDPSFPIRRSRVCALPTCTPSPPPPSRLPGEAKEEKYLKKVILEEVGQQESDPKLSEIVMFENDKKKICFILDGLEECTLPLDFENNKEVKDWKEEASMDELLTNLIKGNLFPESHILIISQPKGVDKIPSEYIDRAVLIHGDAKEEKYLKEIILEEVGQQESDPKLSEIVMFESEKKNVITPKDLFTNNKFLISKHPRMNKNVLMKVAPGIDKTFQTKMFMKDWAKGNSNKHIKALVTFDFTELNSMKDEGKSMESLLNDFFKTKNAVFKDDKKKICFILDGLEECTLPLDFENNKEVKDWKEEASMDELLTNLIKGNLFPESHILIISQPIGVDKIPSEYIDRAVLIHGDAKEEKYLKEIILEEVGQQESDPKLSEIVMFESEKKNVITPKDLFTNNKFLISKHPRMNKNVLMKVAPGIDKTFQTKMFMKDWAKGNSNKHIKALVTFDFTELNSMKDEGKSMESLLNDFFKTKNAVFKDDKKKICFILDGLEECTLPLDFENNKEVKDWKKKKHQWMSC
ncbi:uncharacterized protein LOC129371621 [Poeciliopsis prolifica]|uniref:uncharacterized protein LOC129371621 n=1 Tax=Poeciliopsis prolifica TaxID=188132 RepID=UPI0024131A49|nr:uncharacterized protein LOC129371621 [Poeciliopsis prolifica]